MTTRPPSACTNSKKKQPNTSSGFEVLDYKLLLPGQQPTRSVVFTTRVAATRVAATTTRPGSTKKRYEQMLEEPFNVIQQSGQDPPTSMTSLKTWTNNIKKNLPADKQAAMDQHMQHVQQILEEKQTQQSSAARNGDKMGIANFLDHISGSFTQDFAAAGVSGHLPGSMTCAENAQRTSTTPRKHGNLSAAAAGGGVGIILLLYAPAINKEFLIWLVGLLRLVFVFRRTRQAAAAQQLKERLREKGAVPGLYTFSKFTQPCAVYVKLKAQQHRIRRDPEVGKDVSFCYVGYVGSTNITVAKREYNRVANLRQLQQLKLPKTEIAIRYWHDTQTYDQFSTLLLSQHSEYIDAWTEEHCIIQRWQPKLNPPFHERTREESSWSGSQTTTTARATSP